MSALVTRLKHVARRLHRSLEDGDVQMPGLLEEGETLQRKHCLQAVATRVGFRTWSHTLGVLERRETSDWGKLMYRDSGGAIWNIWSASYEEARGIRAESGGFLLPYGRQFQVVEAPYVEWLGLDPTDTDWDAFGRDWVRPADAAAWGRMTERRLDVVLAGWP